jgi:hypothetical protein
MTIAILALMPVVVKVLLEQICAFSIVGFAFQHIRGCLRLPLAKEDICLVASHAFDLGLDDLAGWMRAPFKLEAVQFVKWLLWPSGTRWELNSKSAECEVVLDGSKIALPTILIKDLGQK